jgi:hypothetical protein
MVIAFLIREHGMTYDEAYRTIKAKRKIVNLNILRFIRMTGSSVNFASLNKRLD